MLAKDAESNGPQDFWFKLSLAEIKLDTGDPVAAQALLSQVPLGYSPTAEIWDTRFRTALCLRDYDAAQRVLVATPAELVGSISGGQPPESLADGLIARLRGDERKAQAVLAVARKRIDATWSDRNKDEKCLARSSALAERDAIARGGEQSNRRCQGSARSVLVVICAGYAWMGERDQRNGEQLEKHSNPSGLNIRRAAIQPGVGFAARDLALENHRLARAEENRQITTQNRGKLLFLSYKLRRARLRSWRSRRE